MNRDRIVFRFLNSKEYAVAQYVAPTRLIGDLGVGYFEMVKEDRGQIITFDQCRKEEISEQELYDLAKANTNRLCPSYVSNIENVILEMGYSIETTIPKEEQLYVITNDRRNCGAIHALYPENLEAIAEIVNDDLYLIPSSIHEMLAISKKAAPDVLELQDMIHEINLTQVSPEDRLSNQVYCYSRETQEFDQVHTGRYLDLEMTPLEGCEEELDEEEDFEFEGYEGMTMGQ